MREMVNASTIIDAFGGPQALARLVQTNRSTISMWRRSGIPAGRCLQIAELAKRHGLQDYTLEVLLRDGVRPAADAGPDDEMPPAPDATPAGDDPIETKTG